MATKRRADRGAKGRKGATVTSRHCVARAKWPRVVQLRVAGKLMTEIASEFSVNSATIGRTLQHPEVVAMIEEAHREISASVNEQLVSLSTQALGVLAELMQGRPDEDGDPTVADAVRRQAATDLLDRCGVARTARTELSGPQGGPVRVDVSRLTSAEIAHLLSRGQGDDESDPDAEG